MAITPFKPAGAGATNQAINVFRVTFSQALSDNPILTAWDDYTVSSTAHGIFVGTTLFPYPLIAGVGGIYPGTEPPSASWFPTSPVAGNTALGTPNLLNGSTNGAKLSTVVPIAGGSVYFNIGFAYPHDLTTISNMSCVIGILFQFTGAIPTVTVFGNNFGSEASPNWSAISSAQSSVAPTPGTTTKIQPCDSNRGDVTGGGDGSYRLTIPVIGTYYPQEIWCTNY